MAVNKQLLKATLAYIEQHPETWVQEEWRCRTGMCFAGWTATLSGCTWAADDPESWVGSVYLVADQADQEGTRPLFYDSASDSIDEERLTVNAVPVVPASDRARRLLGLTQDEANRLFDAANTLDDLRDIVDELCGEDSAASDFDVEDVQAVLDALSNYEPVS